MQIPVLIFFSLAIGLLAAYVCGVLRRLADIERGLAEFETRLNAPRPAPKPEPSTASPIQLRTDLSEILIQRGCEWHHYGWAQTDSDAFESALNQSGFAVKRHNGEIEFGRQV